MEFHRENGFAGNEANMIRRDTKKGSMDVYENGSSSNVSTITSSTVQTTNGSNSSDNNSSNNNSCLKKSLLSFCGSSKKWIVLRFGMIFLISVIILCCVYGLKSTSKHKNSAKAVDSAYAVGDNVYAGDLWVVIELESNGRGVRTALGKAVAAYVCSAIKASQAVGWTPLVVGGKSICCRSSSCRHLHPQDLKQMKFLTTSYFIENNDFSSAMKAAAFLAAIKRGARFIYHANPEVYYKAGISPEQFQQQLEYQLRKTTLGVSVGLVKGKELEVASYFNPYLHFVPSLLNGTEKESNRYKICETKPPSIEKFLDNDGRSMDLSAPPLTLPGKISSPFDSRNTVFARNAFWALLVLPNVLERRSTTSQNDRAVYTFRSIVAQTILAETGGSTKISAAQVATVPDLLLESPMEDMTILINFLNGWKCPLASAVACLDELARTLVARGSLSKSNFEVIDLWTNDLVNVGYEDVPAIRETLDVHYPCVGQNALVGVYFYPSVIEAKLRTSALSKASSSDIDHPRSSSRRLASRGNNAVMMVQRLCPSVDLAYLSSTLSNKFDKHENILLIVTFSDKQYHNLPLMEVLYRHHFKNILYCGEPDEVVDQYMESFRSRQGSQFSFLPTHRHAGYECLLGALEMSYNVDGFLVVDQNTLINSWNFKDLDPKTIWHGNEHAQNITAEIAESDPEDDKAIFKSTFGILKAFQFLEEVLLSARNVTVAPTPAPTVAPPSDDIGRKGDISNLAAIKRSLFKRELEDEFNENVTEPAESSFFEATESSLFEVTQSKLDALDKAEEAENEDEDVGHEDYSAEEISIATQIAEDRLDIEGSGFDVAAIGGVVNFTEPVESPSILEEIEVGVVPEKKEFHISLFGELTKDNEDIDLEGSGESGEIFSESPVAVTIPPVTFYDPSEDSSASDISNLTSTLTATDAAASDLLFHPANFLNVDENEDTSTEPTETDVLLEIESEESAEQDDISSLLSEIDRLYKNINEKLNLWVHFKKNQAIMSAEEIFEARTALENVQCDVSTNTEICHLVAAFFKHLQSNEGKHFQLYHDDLPVYYVPAAFKDKLYLMANLFTKFNVNDELAFPLLLRGLSHSSTWTKLTFSEMIKETQSHELSQPQDLWLSSEAVDAHTQKVEALEASHYLYPVDMKSVLTNGALRNVICRNF